MATRIIAAVVALAIVLPAVIYGGTLKGSWEIYSGFGGTDEFGEQSVTTLHDLAFENVDLWNNGAFVFISGTVGGPGSFIDNQVSVTTKSAFANAASKSRSIAIWPPASRASATISGFGSSVSGPANVSV